MADVSVCIITYNQENFVAQAIESALIQKCNFEIEIIICDDCSTDNTPQIIQSYASKYPNKVKPYYAKQNIGMLKNWEKALKLCNGRYIALLEGDDFWNDENKLQKQYQILERNADCSISFTNAHIKYENQKECFDKYVTITGEKFTTKDLLQYNFIPTCSVMMRNNISDTFLHPAYFKSPFADWIIHILNSQFGSAHFLNGFTCTYRIHHSGVWSGIKEEKQLKNKLQALECINEIITQPKLKLDVKQSRKKLLQTLCAYYRLNNNYLNYLNYRIKLLLN